MKTQQKKVVKEEKVNVNQKCKTAISTVKLPKFDGNTSWQLYYSQRFTASEYNGWTETDKVVNLTMSLQGPALQVLISLGSEERCGFTTVPCALEHRFGEQNLLSMFSIQLENRKSKTNETLQECATDIHHLVQVAYPELRSSLAKTGNMIICQRT